MAKSSGLAIRLRRSTPTSTLQTAVLFNFVVTNTGNFSDQVRFLAGGASVSLTGPGVVTRAVIDLDNSGGINGGDPDIFGNVADVLSASTAQGLSFNVIVEVSVSGAATAGQTVQVFLGDTASQARPSTTRRPYFWLPSAHSSAASVNGLREARGDEAQRFKTMRYSSRSP